jgi:alkaline phosphatase D
MPRLTRRSLLVAGVATGMAAGFPAIAQSGGLSHGMFTHAVASGDPTSAGVILWTRFVTSDARDGEIAWEIAEDESFANIVGGGKSPVQAARDYCVKVDAQGLQAGRPYAFRFVSASGPSATGLTRTAPSGGVAQLRFALFSCSNLGFGYFHAYRDAATRADIELCIHVGDYFYEYARGVYPETDQTPFGRLIEPETEIITASDYHRRYASYRDDPDLQELHRIKPWITVWDDHEIANDTYDGGAENHDPATQGPWEARRATAVRAYLDWMPVRHDPAAPSITRRYDWGDLATILAVDTRMIGRTKQLSYADALGAVAEQDDATFNAAAEAFARGPLADPSRTLLGAAQEDWLSGELKRSKDAGAVWQVLAQQVVAGHQVMPSRVIDFLPSDADATVRAGLALLARAGKLDLPWNLDSWDGYPAARARLLADARANAANMLVLSGDSHNAWASNLGNASGRPMAVEVGGTSVTSPGLETSMTAAPNGGREAAMTEANPELAWCDVTRKGYALVTLTRQTAEARFIATGDVTQRGAPPAGETVLVSEASASGPAGWVSA